MSVDEFDKIAEGSAQLPPRLKSGDVAEVPPTREKLIFDLSELMKVSLQEDKAFEISVEIGSYGRGVFLVIVVNGKASVVETNSTFTNDAYANSHSLYVNNKLSSFELKPRFGSQFPPMRVGVKVEEAEWADRDVYKSLLEKKIEPTWSSVGKTVGLVVGGTSLLVAACCSGAYQVLAGDSAEETPTHQSSSAP
ncbi:MAG: hypothetical protein AAB383_02555 [Patescibacteria group bacterium]